VEVVRELLKYCAIIVDIANKNGWTPLNVAASNGYMEVVRELLKHGVSVDIADDECDTSLHNAPFYGHAEIVRELLSHCASVDIANESGCTPINPAC
jgi:ankyrin repeat protein